MSETPDPSVIQWAIKAANCDALTEAVNLHKAPHRPSGTFRLRMIDRTGTSPRDFVLKVPVPDWIGPRMVATNAHALQVAAAHGLAAPRLVAADRSGRSGGTAATLETWLPGTSSLPTTLRTGLLERAGAALATIHSIPFTPSDELPYRPRPVAVDDFASDRREQRMHTTPLLQRADRRIRAHGVPDGESVLVHGDAHPGNMLWTDSATTLIDWKTAGVGDPGVDIGDLRLQVSVRYGLHAAAAVLDGWKQQARATEPMIAYWDAVAALNTPTELHGWPGFAEDGRPLDIKAITQRRDDFLRSALTRLDA